MKAQHDDVSRQTKALKPDSLPEHGRSFNGVVSVLWPTDK